MLTGARIASVGSALPATSVGNDELARRLGVTEDWILQRTGIRSRRVCEPTQSTTSLAAAASIDTLARARMSPDDLDLVIVATVTADHRFPACAALVQSEIGAGRAGAYDLNAGCAGFLYALAQSGALVRSGAADRVLVCGADVLSRLTDPTDVSSCVLFGDAAAAVVVERSAHSALGPFILRADGSQPELLFVSPETGLIEMRGREVYRRAVDEMTAAIEEVLSLSGASTDDVALVVAHQANARILDAVAARLTISPDKVFQNISDYGNTSAASIPLALSDAWQQGRLRAADRVVVAAFGAGFAWGAGVVEWEVADAERPPAAVGAASHG